MEKVLYEELFPDEFAERIKKMPVAFLPLGTLEWHGPHMPLGADGIQSKELFIELAGKMGGVVLPMLFVGPDRVFDDRGELFYGMDINTEGALNTYCMVATGMGTVVDTLEASLNEVCMQSLSQITIEDISQQLIAIENHKNKEE